jgi:hypothetical protein
MSRFHNALLAMALAGGSSACSDNESPPLPDHTPKTYSLEVGGVPVTPPLTLFTGQTVRVRIRFFNAAGEDLDEVESEHFGGLTFSPASLAAATRLAANHYQFDVAVGDPGTGTLTVRFGHEESADEFDFDPVSLTVMETGGNQ